METDAVLARFRPLKHRQAVSLFAGAGGMDIGVNEAGFRTVCSIDFDPHCTNTLRRNFSSRNTVWNVDVRAVDPERLLEVLGLEVGELGLLHGGPPCQPFSQIGKRHGTDDPRGMLVFEMPRFAEKLRPVAVMIEQVPYFVRATMPDGQAAVRALAQKFDRLGYEMHAETLHADLSREVDRLNLQTEPLQKTSRPSSPSS